ncbi:outer membrane lipoprotein-sorting protein [Halothermothrix orenii]|uniref:Putative sigma E regulatory protein, MucB/RseB n=1 Tax=Halothermothrix orenii (strain H 168 / OCM 544 / DSM 9562) TaxID=373903 RepID=B8D1B5_HALOH|nr:outer membrane lipoprotein-sorting protein [Halothermothrix orenii]ACL71067.1 putative sigma E regulatory protein, MucB/RseB [Halothermothrix orenii H 168]
MFNKTTRILLLIMTMTVVFSSLSIAITPEEIINRRDDNEYVRSAKIESEMIIIKGNRKIIKTMVSITDGKNALVEFINPLDRGTKFLKRDDNLFMFFPDAEDIVKISGHMLEQGIMGSDLSYKDIMESDKLTELYDFKILREEEYQGRPCYVMEGIAREGAEVSYYRRVAWIDKERFIGLKEELYARSGRLLKVMKVDKVEEIEGRYYPTEYITEDKLIKNSRTIFRVKSINFNPEIPENTFTLQNLN